MPRAISILVVTVSLVQMSTQLRADAEAAKKQLTERTGEGLAGSNRITLTWPENAIRNQWLQVISPDGWLNWPMLLL